MHALINGVRLFFDVAGEKVVADGPQMRERPTLLLLHGGPGFDHSMFKPSFAPLAELAQLIYLDHRGNGRSEHGDPALWTLDQWGDDVRAFCDALGIEKPIVLGYSFGGFVAQSYATRHPDHPAKLVLYSTTPVLDDGPVLDAFEFDWRRRGARDRSSIFCRPHAREHGGIPRNLLSAIQYETRRSQPGPALDRQQRGLGQFLRGRRQAV